MAADGNAERRGAPACNPGRRSHDAAPLPPPAARVHLALLTVSLIFGANFVVTKQLLAAVPAQAWIGFRVVAAAALLLPIALWLGRGTVPTRAWPLLLLASLLGVFGNQALFAEGLARTTSTHSVVLNACIPTWTLLLAAALGQERLTLRKAAAVATALCGVAWLLRVDQMLGSGETLSEQQLLGDALSLCNGFAFALHLVLMRRIGKDVDSYRATGALFLFGLLTVPLYSAPAMTADNLALATTPPVLWLALFAVLLATVTTYLLNAWALRHTTSSTVALYINAQPLVAAALGPMFDQPAPDARFFVAFLCVAASLVVQSRAQ
jgi:drug/metabolite transporter (DMT)-like permease